MDGYSPLEGGGIQRTDMHCHECNKTFIVELNYDINGDHIVHCPYCDHEHCRTIKDGKITGDRWSSKPDKRINVDKRCIWKSGIVKTKENHHIHSKVSTVSIFIRDKWLNHGA